MGCPGETSWQEGIQAQTDAVSGGLCPASAVSGDLCPVLCLPFLPRYPGVPLAGADALDGIAVVPAEGGTGTHYTNHTFRFDPDSIHGGQLRRVVLLRTDAHVVLELADRRRRHDPGRTGHFDDCGLRADPSRLSVQKGDHWHLSDRSRGVKPRLTTPRCLFQTLCHAKPIGTARTWNASFLNFQALAARCSAPNGWHGLWAAGSMISCRYSNQVMWGAFNGAWSRAGRKHTCHGQLI